MGYGQVGLVASGGIGWTGLAYLNLQSEGVQDIAAVPGEGVGC
jgi:hypothetical protein